MRSTRCHPDGLMLFEPTVHEDDRGAFFESFNALAFAEATGTSAYFAQDNQSISSAGVVRGLHYQLPPYAQGKLVRVSAGRVFDVAVDLRDGSDTFGRWFGVELSAVNHLQLWIPPGFAHGFLALEDGSEVLYKTTEFWHRESERALRWDDPDIGIAWPAEGLRIIISDKDALAPGFAELTNSAPARLA
ncbi:dTDP-4-dehydrorhamnose 3,5-epimerase [Devosia crocina]|uniref:dTDP-4-dehydrorhamnose 3,5-epimerase n=1 Tax=Devosia crocina TaxID=429728 RepID=A0A1I7MZB6_9HYPH|nr:dTDP-4-dehydrorhamnose 3,5-epimerase [Devosia crocina]SFV27763.1 dTDP-4-dehydrorhamnose 3,5-epimerase [Devosia crocina]